jgi:hypothetical protein
LNGAEASSSGEDECCFSTNCSHDSKSLVTALDAVLPKTFPIAHSAVDRIYLLVPAISGSLKAV